VSFSELGMNRRQRGDIVYLTFGCLEKVAGLFHAVSTRRGGVSLSPFDSLNLGFHVGDDFGAVLENRRRFAGAAGFELGNVVTTRQVHGADVRVVGRADCGRGAVQEPDELWACDALVTRDRGVYLMAFSADCPLAMLVDARAGVLGLAHAGWRSAFAGVLSRTMSAMADLGAQVSRVVAGISPAIGPCCYEVGGDLRDKVPPDVRAPDRFFHPHKGKFLFDLPLFCREAVRNEGVSDDSIESAGLCTSCTGELMFSSRASGGRTGRYAAVVGWTG